MSKDLIWESRSVAGNSCWGPGVIQGWMKAGHCRLIDSHMGWTQGKALSGQNTDPWVWHVHGWLHGFDLGSLGNFMIYKYNSSDDWYVLKAENYELCSINKLSVILCLVTLVELVTCFIDGIFKVATAVFSICITHQGLKANWWYVSDTYNNFLIKNYSIFIQMVKYQNYHWFWKLYFIVIWTVWYWFILFKWLSCSIFGTHPLKLYIIYGIDHGQEGVTATKSEWFVVWRRDFPAGQQITRVVLP